jgi:hypothetical protein
VVLGISGDGFLGFDDNRHAVDPVDLAIRIVEGVHEDDSAHGRDIPVNVVHLNIDLALLNTEVLGGITDNPGNLSSVLAFRAGIGDVDDGSVFGSRGAENLDGSDGVESRTIRILDQSQHGLLLLLALGQKQGRRITVVSGAQTATLWFEKDQHKCCE